jgi:AbrB family looped-hinge helix DNA binding protein
MKVKVSSKYQVVIPKEIRKRFHISPGENFEIISFKDRIEFIPVKNIKDMRGVLQGVDSNVEREGNRV